VLGHNENTNGGVMDVKSIGETELVSKGERFPERNINGGMMIWRNSKGRICPVSPLFY